MRGLWPLLLFTFKLIKERGKMAIILNQSKGNFKIILERDDALESSKEDHEAYLKAGLKEELLKFKEGKQPTRFVMRKTLDYDSQQQILNEQIQYKRSNKGKMEQQLNMSFVLSEVKNSLVDIENPADLPEEQHIIYKNDSDGSTSKDLISLLHGAGIVMELYGIRSALLTENTEKVEALKKS